jgi:hypothetical protein
MKGYENLPSAGGTGRTAESRATGALHAAGPEPAGPARGSSAHGPAAQRGRSRAQHQPGIARGRRPIWLPAWQASTWLLIGWTGTVGLVIVAESSRLDACPYYAEHISGCGISLRPPLTGTAAIGGLAAVWLGGIAILLLLCRLDRHTTRTATAAPPRALSRLMLVVASLAGVLAGAHFLLLAPMISHPVCARPVHVNRFMAYPLNCDSALFLQLAQHPADLLVKGSLGHESAVAAWRLRTDHLRQSRPGYVALSAFGSRLLGSPAARLGLDRAYGQTDPAYIPLILINLAVVVTAVVLLARLLGQFGAPACVVVSLCSLLVLNDLMKAFFWTPHQQMFALLTPLGTITAGRWLILKRPGPLSVAVLGLGLGLGALIYPNVVITVGVLIVILLACGRRRIVRALALFATFPVAPAAWIWTCRTISGTYLDNDIAVYREFIWLPQALGQGWRVFADRLELASVAGIREVAGADGLVLGILAASVVAAILAGARLGAVTRQDTATLAATGLTLGFSLLFGWGIGIITTRVMFETFPALLVLAGWMAMRFAASSRATLLAASYGLAAIAVANALHEVLTHGPYS